MDGYKEEGTVAGGCYHYCKPLSAVHCYVWGGGAFAQGPGPQDEKRYACALLAASDRSIAVGVVT